VNSVEPRTVPQDFIHPILPDREWEKLIEHNPLIVPPDLLLGFLENVLSVASGIGRIGTQSINHGIVKL
jgi:hypothetical protein